MSSTYGDVRIQCSSDQASSSDRRGNSKSMSKSYNALRLLLQDSINEEIDSVIQKYVEQYFIPAAENMENNQECGFMPSTGMPPRQYIKAVCKQILDDAKKMY